jgi:hypothetical protein
MGPPLSIVRLIVSGNLNRRHLNPGQRAVFGLSLKPYLADLAKERQRAGGKEAGRGRSKVVPDPAEPIPKQLQVREEIAAIVGVGNNAVSQAEYLADNAPDLLVRIVGCSRPRTTVCIPDVRSSSPAVVGWD